MYTLGTLNGQSFNLPNRRDFVDDVPSPNDDFRLVVELPWSAMNVP